MTGNADMDFTGKVVLVTGGASGIGGAATQKFAQAGAKVAFTYLTSADEALAIEAECRNVGQVALAFKADMTMPGEVADVVAKIEAEIGSVDVLFANAGGLLKRQRCVDFQPRALAASILDQSVQHVSCGASGAALDGASENRFDRVDVLPGGVRRRRPRRFPLCRQ